MIKNLFHITLISYLWKRYKAIIVSTLILFIFFWLIGKLHEDFVSYGHLNDDKQYIGLSFILKWFAFLTAFIVYFVFNTRYLSSGKQLDANKAGASRKLSSRESGKKSAEVFNEHNIESDESDPFEAIRKKDTLRSVGDFIIEKEQS